MNKIKVIVIESNHLNRQGLSLALQTKEEIEVIGDASTGKDGLDLLLNQPSCNIIIMQLALPKMDGIDLIKEIKQYQQKGELANVKIIVLTENTEPETVINTFSAGADSYILKNVDLEELTKAIVVTDEGNSWIDPNIAKVVLDEARKKTLTVQNLSRSANFSSSCNNAMDSIDKEGNISPEYQNIMDNNPLTDRELDVLELIVSGCNNAQIAEKLFITVGTVKTHVRSILAKLCVNDRTQAAVTALRTGLVE